MKILAVCFFLFISSLTGAWSQTSSLPNRPAAPGAALTSKDIHVYPFAEEHKDMLFKPTDRSIPNELIVTVTDHIHMYGKKKSRVAQVLGVPTGHVGKLVMLPPGDRSGTLTIKKSFGTTKFLNCFELAGDKLDSQEMKLSEGSTYNWSVKNEGTNTTFRLTSADNKEIAHHTIESANVQGIGFAGTVRNEGNEIDLTITFDH